MFLSSLLKIKFHKKDRIFFIFLNKLSINNSINKCFINIYLLKINIYKIEIFKKY